MKLKEVLRFFAIPLVFCLVTPKWRRSVLLVFVFARWHFRNVLEFFWKVGVIIIPTFLSELHKRKLVFIYVYQKTCALDTYFGQKFVWRFPRNLFKAWTDIILRISAFRQNWCQIDFGIKCILGYFSLWNSIIFQENINESWYSVEDKLKKVC